MKPTGIWSHHAGIPSWAGFAQLVAEYLTDEELRWARDYAAGRNAAGLPFAWVLALTGPDKYAPMGEWLPATAKRIEASGVRPYIAAVSYREEWYGADTTINQVEMTQAWINAQHKVIRRTWPGLPIVAIEGFWCPTSAFGPAFYRPEYDHDIRGVEAFVPAGQTWHSELMDAKFALACGEAVGPYRLPKKPVVIVSQAFRSTGQWAEWVTDDTIAHTARWLQHPAVIAHWPFDFAGSLAGSWQGWTEWSERHKLTAWGIR